LNTSARSACFRYDERRDLLDVVLEERLAAVIGEERALGRLDRAPAGKLKGKDPQSDES
jgi:hypothetical protein